MVIIITNKLKMKIISNILIFKYRMYFKILQMEVIQNYLIFIHINNFIYVINKILMFQKMVIQIFNQVIGTLIQRAKLFFALVIKVKFIYKVQEQVKLTIKIVHILIYQSIDVIIKHFKIKIQILLVNQRMKSRIIYKLKNLF